MTGLLDWLKSLYTVGVQYICWLGLATLVFSHSLEKRKMACLKGSAATAGFLLLGMLASSTAVDGALPVVWYFVLPLVNMLLGQMPGAPAAVLAPARASRGPRP